MGTMGVMASPTEWGRWGRGGGGRFSEGVLAGGQAWRETFTPGQQPGSHRPHSVHRPGGPKRGGMARRFVDSCARRGEYGRSGCRRDGSRHGASRARAEQLRTSWAGSRLPGVGAGPPKKGVAAPPCGGQGVRAGGGGFARRRPVPRERRRGPPVRRSGRQDRESRFRDAEVGPPREESALPGADARAPFDAEAARPKNNPSRIDPSSGLSR
jgi:hypothetical protein